MVTRELYKMPTQSVHPYHSKRVGILRLRLKKSQSLSATASECVAGEVFHYSSDAYGSCMYGPVDKTATLHCSASKLKTQN